ncbi:MAG: hypothetical protein HYT80_02395 [Euryarchaeota archaeon]|nr:hypothetical protein [Euryarchaeota archaeon]
MVAVAAVAVMLPIGTAENQSPFVRKEGDTMTGNLKMDGSAVVFTGGELKSQGGALTYAGQAVCTQGAPCGAAAMGPRAFGTNAPNYVNFNGAGVCTMHEMKLDVEALGPGLILLSGTVTLEYEHYQGTQEWGRVTIGRVDGGCANPADLFSSVFSLNEEHGNGYYQQTVPVTRFEYAPAAGTYSYSIFGAVEQGFSPGAPPGFPPDRFLWANLHAIWVPE